MPFSPHITPHQLFCGQSCRISVDGHLPESSVRAFGSNRAPSYRTPGASRRTVKPNRAAPSASEPYRDINKFKLQYTSNPICRSIAFNTLNAASKHHSPLAALDLSGHLRTLFNSPRRDQKSAGHREQHRECGSPQRIVHHRVQEQ